MERLDVWERRNNELQESFRTLQANFTRVDAENQALRTWSCNQLLRLWDGVVSQGQDTTSTMKRILQTVSDDSGRHKRIKELMEELKRCMVEPPKDFVVPTPTIPSPPPTVRPKYIEIPDVNTKPAATASGSSPADDVDEFANRPSAGRQDVEEGEVLSGVRQTRQRSRPPSRQGSAVPHPVRAARKRDISVVPEEVDEGQATKKQKTS